MTELIVKKFPACRQAGKKLIVSILLIVAIGGFILLKKDNSEAEEDSAAKDDKIITVGVRKAEESRIIDGKIKYPAAIVGDQEVKITAPTGGTATAVNFSLGDQVGQGKVLVKIDDLGSSSGEKGFRSGQIQQLENAVEQADEAYDQAKDAYKDLKTDANKTARDLAKLQRENAEIALQSAIDNRLVKASIAGTIISKNISTGDSIAPGQLLATISKTNKLKIQFFVDKEELGSVAVGGTVMIENSGVSTPAKITNVSSQADPATRRFLVEAVPSKNENLSIGTIVNVSLDVKQSVTGNNTLILPLSALTIGQNETFIFIVSDGKAKKIPATIVKISGETAEVSVDLNSDDLIIVEGNKRVQDGEVVEVKN